MNAEKVRDKNKRDSQSDANLMENLKQSRVIQVSKWGDYLKQAENLYLIGENQFSFQKCNELFDSMITVFAQKWNLDIKDPRFNDNLSDNLKKLSNPMEVLVEEIYNLRVKFCQSPELEYNLEKMISNLQKILLTIKESIKSIPQNQIQDNNKDPNKVTTVNKIEQPDTSNIADNERKEEISESLWNALIIAIENFEYRNAKLLE